MADPIVPDPQTIDDSASMLERLTSVIAGNTTALRVLSDVSKATGVDFKNLSNMGAEASNAFGLVNTKLLAVNDSMSKLGGADFSNSFVKQFQDIQKHANTMLDETHLTKMLQNLGAKIPGVGMGFKELQDYAGKFFATMDQRARLGDFFISAAASTGQLANAFSSGANPLETFNDKLTKTSSILLSAEKGTGLTTEQITGFYSQIARIPGAMDGFSNSIRKGQQTTSLLQASIELARGTGSDYSDIVKDMTNAYEDLNLKGQNALNMTTRISEVSSKTGLRLADVRGIITTTAEQFQFFGNSIDGTSQLVANYSKALDQVGLSSKQIITINAGFIESVYKLTAAQKAYLSQQTGGPGGLQGSFQIDKMLSEGKVDQVFDKMKGTLQKQFGKVLTLDDAGQSQQAAAQFEKQIQMITQGPLGSLVKTREQAFKVSEMLKKGETITKEKISDNLEGTQQDQRKKGAALLDSQNTAMSVARADIRAAQVSIEGTNFALGTRALTTAEVDRKKGNLDEPDLEKERLKRKIAEGGNIGKKDVTMDPEATAQAAGKKGLDGFLSAFNVVPGMMSGVKKIFSYGLGTNAQEQEEIKKAELDRKIKEQKEADAQKKKDIAGRMAGQPILDSAAEARRVATAQTKKKPDQQAPDQIAHRHMKDGKSEVVQLEINAYCASCHAKIHVPQTRSSSNPTSVHKQVGNNYG